ncbi:hypothetical protein ACQJBY_017625 [Aegilops geniculata]
MLVSDPSVTPTLSLLPLLHHRRLNQRDQRPEPDTSHHITPLLLLDSIELLITHKYRGSQQFSRVEYSTQIYRFDTRGAKEYLKVLAAELSIQPHLEINYLQQVISSKVI